MKKWTVGEYEDDADMGFIGQEGGSICWIDDILLYKATIIAERHNAELARVTEGRDGYKTLYEQAHEHTHEAVNDRDEFLKKAAKMAFESEVIQPQMLMLHLEDLPGVTAEQFEQDWIADWIAALRPSK